MPDKIIRRAEQSDVERMVELVHELAEYQRAAQQCELTPAALRAALFGPNPATFAHVAELDGDVVGMVLWFRSFSTWTGVHGIYLEDLFVRPAHRGCGLGRALLAVLAEECVRHGYRRLEWSVLDWNTPSIGFYTALGAVPLDGLTTFRLSGDQLTALGKS